MYSLLTCVKVHIHWEILIGVFRHSCYLAMYNSNRHTEFIMSCHRLMDEISSLSLGRPVESPDLRTASILASFPVYLENEFTVMAQTHNPRNNHH